MSAINCAKIDDSNEKEQKKKTQTDGQVLSYEDQYFQEEEKERVFTLVTYLKKTMVLLLMNCYHW